MDKRDVILNFIKLKGPILPISIAKYLNTSLLLASAMLAELSSKGKVKLSYLKIGSSPLYFLKGQEAMLESHAESLGQKEKQAFDLLKEHQVLRDSDLNTLMRVCLREIKDFATALQVSANNTVEIFWKWHTLPDSKAEQKIKSILNFVEEQKKEAKKKGEEERQQRLAEERRKLEYEQKRIAEEKQRTEEAKQKNIEAENRRLENEKRRRDEEDSRIKELGERKREEEKRSNDAAKKRKLEEENSRIKAQKELFLAEKKDFEKERQKFEEKKRKLGEFSRLKEQEFKEQERLRKKEIKNPKSNKKLIGSEGQIVKKDKFIDTSGDKFFQVIQAFFKKNNIKILEKECVKKEAEFSFIIALPTPLGNLTCFLNAKNKKRLSDGDFSTVYIKGQSRKLPTILLSQGKPTKKAQDLLLKELRGLMFTEL